MDRLRVQDAGRTLAELEERMSYTDWAAAMGELDPQDWRYAVATGALEAAYDALVAAREAMCALANVLEDGRGQLTGPAVTNRLGHWVCGDGPAVFEAAMQQIQPKPSMF